jgi:ankyrin repeat protein
MDELTTQHGLAGVSYSTVRDYVAHRRSLTTPQSLPTSADIVRAQPPPSAHRGPDMSWSPAHDAVEHEDLPQLRDLLDAGHDVEDDNGDGRTLLRHAIDIEHDGHVQTGDPLHTDITAFLLARGADPLRRLNGMTVIEEAQIRGHWLAAEIMRGWINRGQHPSPS